MEGFTVILVMALLLLILDIAAVTLGVDSRGSFVDEHFRPSVG
jgi:hypothetical protein